MISYTYYIFTDLQLLEKRGEYFAEKKKICLIFHGWEYLLLLILIAKAGKNHGVIGFTLGYAIHLILDTLGNDCTIKGYSIIYRKKVDWDIKKICVRNGE